MVEKITSLHNPRLKLIRKLRDKKGRDQERRFVIDDTRDLARALAEGYEVDFALHCPALGDYVRGLPAQRVVEIPRDLMEKVSYRQNPSAIVAVLHQKPHSDPRTAGDLILGLVGLQKPGNIGALLRSADALGFKTIFLIDTSLDLYNPNIIRSSTGANFLNNIYALSTAQALSLFRAQGYRILAAHVDGVLPLHQADFLGKAALLLGTEDIGLPASWVEHSDALVRIPMTGTLTDSLNVAAAGAIMMYEALRQRLAAQPGSSA